MGLRLHITKNFGQHLPVTSERPRPTVPIQAFSGCKKLAIRFQLAEHGLVVLCLYTDAIPTSSTGQAYAEGFTLHATLCFCQSGLRHPHDLILV